jgi:hypothetical protein
VLPRKSAATIPAPAAPAKNTKNATAKRPEIRPSQAHLCYFSKSN